MRLLKGLGVALAVLLVLAGVGWFVAKHAIEGGVDAALADARAQGRQAEVAARKVAGFPLWLDLRLTGLTLADPLSGTGWQAPSLSVAAPIWAPWRLMATLPDTQTLALPDQQVGVQSAGLEAELHSALDSDLPLRHAAFRADNITLHSDRGWALTLGDVSADFTADDSRPPGTYVLDFDLAPLGPDPAFLAALQGTVLPDLPAPDFPAQIEVLRGTIGLRWSAPLDRHASRTNPQLEAVEVTSVDFGWGALFFHAEGLIEADAEGYAEGKVRLELTNWDRLPAILVAAGMVPAERTGLITGAMRVMAAASPDPAVLALTLDMEEGHMSLGPFPLGPAPRLRPPSS